MTKSTRIPLDDFPDFYLLEGACNGDRVEKMSLNSSSSSHSISVANMMWNGRRRAFVNETYSKKEMVTVITTQWLFRKYFGVAYQIRPAPLVIISSGDTWSHTFLNVGRK